MRELCEVDLDSGGRGQRACHRGISSYIYSPPVEANLRPPEFKEAGVMGAKTKEIIARHWATRWLSGR